MTVVVRYRTVFWLAALGGALYAVSRWMGTIKVPVAPAQPPPSPEGGY